MDEVLDTEASAASRSSWSATTRKWSSSTSASRRPPPNAGLLLNLHGAYMPACNASLDFLSEGRYRAMVWEDGDAPNEVLRSERIVTALNDPVLRMSSAGGLPLFWSRPINEHQAPRSGRHGHCRGAIPEP
ncbi:hypothetical protein [Pseudoxanthomonas sp. CF125]|uniref:hypothetical protein n=1 Tax=Pseudoxanthomonas sp. CF125 TaxID=1855303 RepID=UPI00115FE645|nr:hypothetical protein [Pseudoxanthomonas sp. CF125]